MTRTLWTATLAALLLLEAPAFAQPQAMRAEPPCLRNRNIYNYQLVPGNRSLIVTDLSRRRYRLDFLGKCYDLQHEFGLAFRTRGVTGLSCLGKGDSVVLRNAVGPGQCFISNIEYQTPAMDRADYEAAGAMRRR